MPDDAFYIYGSQASTQGIRDEYEKIGAFIAVYDSLSSKKKTLYSVRLSGDWEKVDAVIEGTAFSRDQGHIVDGVDMWPQIIADRTLG